MNYFHNKLISKKNMRSSKQDTHRPKENDNDIPPYPPNWKIRTTDQKITENPGHLPKIQDSERAARDVL